MRNFRRKFLQENKELVYYNDILLQYFCLQKQFYQVQFDIDLILLDDIKEKLSKKKLNIEKNYIAKQKKLNNF